MAVLRLSDIIKGGGAPAQPTEEAPAPGLAPAVGPAPRATRLSDIIRGPSLFEEPSGIQAEIAQRREQATLTQDISEQAARIRADLERLGQDKPEEVKDWRAVARSIVQLMEMEGDDEQSKEARKLANDFAIRYEDQLRPHIEVATGSPDWFDEHVEKPKGPSGFMGFVGDVLSAPGVSQALELLDVPSQMTLGAIKSLREGLDDGFDLSDISQAAVEGFTQPARAHYDPAERLDFRTATGLEVDGWMGDVLDIAGTIATDPLTYISLGVGGAAKSALGTVAKRSAKELGGNASEQLIRNIRRHGFKSLSKETQDQVRRWLREEAVEGLARFAEGASPTIRQRIARNVRRVSADLAKEADKAADKGVRALARGGQSGVRVLGRTVLPTGWIGEALERAGILDSPTFRRVGADEAAEAAEDAVRPPLFDDPHTYSQPRLFDTEFNAPRGVQEELPFPGPEPEQLSFIVDEVVANPQLLDDPDVLDTVADLLPPTSNTPGIPFGPGRREAAKAALRSLAGRRGAASRAGRLAEAIPGEAAPFDPRLLPPRSATGAPRRAGETRRQAAERFLRNQRQLRGAETLRARRAADEAGATAMPGPRFLPDRLPEQRLLDIEFDAAARRRLPMLDEVGEAVQPSLLDSAPPPRRLIPAAGDAKQLSLDDAPRYEHFTGRLFDPDAARVMNTVEEVVEEVASKIDEVAPLFDDVVKTVRRGIVSKVLDKKFFRVIREAIIPRARIARNIKLGKRGAQVTDNLMAQAAAELNNATTDMLLRLEGGLVERAVAEAGGRDSLNQVLNRAMSSGAKMADEMAKLPEGSAIRQLLETAGEIRRDIRDWAIRAGADPDLLREADNYIPRVISDPAQRRLKEALAKDDGTIRDAFTRAGFIDPETGALFDDAADRVLRQDGFLRKRGIDPDEQDLFRVNEVAARILREYGVEGFDDIFETDVLKALAVRGRSAMEAAVTTGMYRGLTKETAADGLALAYRVGKDEAFPSVKFTARGGKVSDYVERKLPNGDRYFVRKEILDEIESVQRVISDPSEMQGLARVFDKWNSLWASYATVPLIGLAFHARNAQGNLFNAFLAGLKNPARYAEAFKLQSRANKARRIMADEGLDWAAAAKKAGLSDAERELIDAARKQGVYSGGQVGDIFNENRTTLANRGGGLNPLSQRFFALRSGRIVGEAVEHNARLALFLDGVKKGMTAEDAASRVRRYLFDYSDLTKFESRNLRTISRFYTFFRKNLSLQAASLIMYPGRVANAQRIAEGWANFILPEDPDFNGIIPEWAGPAGAVVRASRSAPGVHAVGGPDTPLQAAAETLDQFGAMASMVPVANRVIPPNMAYGDRRERASRALGFLAGGPAEFLDYMYGERFGRDPFTGAVLDGSAQDTWMRITDIFAPVVSKAGREFEKFTEETWQLRAMNALLGLSTYELSEDQQMSALDAIRSELLDALQEAEREGVDVPTFDELVEAGKIMQASRALEAYLYSEDDQERLERLDEGIPQQIRDAVGMARVTPLEPTEEMTQAEIDRQIAEIKFRVIESRKMQGLPPLTDDEWVDLMMALPWMPKKADQEELGLEPRRTGNVFLPGTQDPEETIEQTRARIDGIARNFGMTADQLIRLRPRLTEAERILQDAAEAGLGPEAAAQYLIDNWSRKELGIVFGTDSLPQFRDTRYTVEDAIRDREQAWERRAALNLVMWARFGRPPTEEEALQFLTWNAMTQGELEAVGLEKAPRIPSTKDPRTDAEFHRDSLATLSSVIEGATLGPYIGDQ